MHLDVDGAAALQVDSLGLITDVADLQRTGRRAVQGEVTSYVGNSTHGTT